jgi:hypothetical protein
LEILAEGGAKARKRANKKMGFVRKSVGFLLDKIKNTL